MIEYTAGDAFEDSDGVGKCSDCGASLSGGDVVFNWYDGEDSGDVCEPCGKEREQQDEQDCSQAELEAKAWAAERCKLLHTPPPFSEWVKGRRIPTPEEYATGVRESRSINGFECYLRHECTNYEQLLDEIDRLSEGFQSRQIRKDAVRRRIREIVQPLVDQAWIDTHEEA